MPNFDVHLPSVVGNVSIPTWYFLWLPVDNKVLYAEQLSNSPMHQQQASVYDWLIGLSSTSVTIPVPIETARSLGWIDNATVERNFEVSDTVLAALRLVKGT